VGQEAPVERYGVDDAFPIGDIDEHPLPGLIEGRSRNLLPAGQKTCFDTRVYGLGKSDSQQGAHRRLAPPANLRR